MDALRLSVAMRFTDLNGERNAGPWSGSDTRKHQSGPARAYSRIRRLSIGVSTNISRPAARPIHIMSENTLE